LPTDYGLHDIPGAKVLSFFASHYAVFSDFLEDSLRSIGKSNYKTVFTGHSLGGALAVHAAVDMILEDFWDVWNFKVYTFG